MPAIQQADQEPLPAVVSQKGSHRSEKRSTLSQDIEGQWSKEDQWKRRLLHPLLYKEKYQSSKFAAFRFSFKFQQPFDVQTTVPSLLNFCTT